LIRPKISGLRVLIVGDIAHSRVARSNIYGLTRLGAKVTLCGPPTLIPSYFSRLGVKISFHLPEAIKEADVVMMLRIQLERQDSLNLPSKSEYVKFYRLHPDLLKLAKKDLIVMHPGPINRGVEISSEAADGPQSVILNQVTNGVAVRMALLETALGKNKGAS
jgi:aspartate carbamoyltransferase catalytic subunit